MVGCLGVGDVSMQRPRDKVPANKVIREPPSVHNGQHIYAQALVKITAHADPHRLYRH